MGTFELDCGNMNEQAAALDNAVDCGGCGHGDTRRIKQECIICAKVYDQCRHLDGKKYTCARMHEKKSSAGVSKGRVYLYHFADFPLEAGDDFLFESGYVGLGDAQNIGDLLLGFFNTLRL